MLVKPFLFLVLLLSASSLLLALILTAALHGAVATSRTPVVDDSNAKAAFVNNYAAATRRHVTPAVTSQSGQKWHGRFFCAIAHNNWIDSGNLFPSASASCVPFSNIGLGVRQCWLAKSVVLSHSRKNPDEEFEDDEGKSSLYVPSDNKEEKIEDNTARFSPRKKRSMELVFPLQNRNREIVPLVSESDDWDDSLPSLGLSPADDSSLQKGEEEDTSSVLSKNDLPPSTNSSALPSLLGSTNLNLAEEPQIAYFYLQNTLGLPEDVMWKITLEAGSVLGMTVQNLEGKIALLRRTMKLSDEDVRTILEKQPAILHLSANKNVAPTILFLVRSLDLSKDELRQIVVSYPAILCYSIKNLKSKLQFFTIMMGYTIAECRDLFMSEPKLLTAGVETGLMKRLKFLHREMLIPLDKLRTIIRRNPRVLLYSVDDNLRPKLIDHFVMKLRMETKHVQRILSAYPEVLDYNLQEHILPITRYFVSELEFSPMELRSILLKFPRLITHSLRKIKHVVGYFRYELGMNAVQVKRVLFQAPQTIGLNTETNLKDKVDFLQQSFDLSDEELRKVVSGMPTLVICGVETNLRPKVEYLLEQFGNNKDELRDAIITQPTLLGYSLNKRIKPRMEKLLAIGASPRKITVGITMTEPSFEEWLHSKKLKIEKNGGKEPTRRTRRNKSQKKDLATQSTPSSLVLVVSEEDRRRKEEDDKRRQEEEKRKGRIVHWTRERRPRPF